MTASMRHDIRGGSIGRTGGEICSEDVLPSTNRFVDKIRGNFIHKAVCADRATDKQAAAVAFSETPNITRGRNGLRVSQIGGKRAFVSQFA